MEVDLVRRTPRSVALVRECRRTSDGAKEVHSPLCALSRAVVDIEKTQWDLDVGNPHLISVIEGCASLNTVCRQVGDVEAVERSARRSNLGRVIDWKNGPKSAYQAPFRKVASHKRRFRI